MPDKKVDQLVPEEPSDKAGKAAALPSEQSVRPKESKPGRTRALWCLLLLLLVITVAQYYGLTYELRELETEVHTQATKANQAQEDIRRALRELQNQQAGQAKALANRLREKSSVQVLALAEIEYLLTIATHRLTLERDIGAALAAMHAANARLQGLDDPTLSPLRAQIAADLDRLSAIETPDLSSLAVYLADLSARSATFPVRAEVIKPVVEPEADEPSPVPDTRPVWQKLPGLWWHEIKKLVRIERVDAEVFLLPDQAYLLSQNLRLELANARYSVLRSDTENLSASAGLIQDWLVRYFDSDDASVANVIETMQAMMQIELQPALPDLSASLESVRAYLRHADEAGAAVD